MASNRKSTAVRSGWRLQVATWVVVVVAAAVAVVVAVGVAVAVAAVMVTVAGVAAG